MSYFQKISITPYLFIIYKSTITFNKLKRKIKNIILNSTGDPTRLIKQNSYARISKKAD